MAEPRSGGVVNFGDVVTVDFGTPIGSEAGLTRPAVLVTADAFLRFRPSTVFAVPITSTPRVFPSHVGIEPDERNGLTMSSCALVEQMRAVAVERCSAPQGNLGPVVSHQILDVLAMITGMP
ncbi:MAG: type II toxin-antitoxin system PemK/MazF family toxin [Actinobacteria bacterium]|nr:type II toxin-antitoxin system PemK/MazF family toxin [Actinomycetota bacterium]